MMAHVRLCLHDTACAILSHAVGRRRLVYRWLGGGGGEQAARGETNGREQAAT